MRFRTSREVAALGLLGALTACGSEELFAQRLDANQKSIHSEAVARITSDDRVLGRVVSVGDMDGDGIDDAILLSGATSTEHVETSTDVRPAGSLRRYRYALDWHRQPVDARSRLVGLAVAEGGRCHGA